MDELESSSFVVPPSRKRREHPSPAMTPESVSVYARAHTHTREREAVLSHTHTHTHTHTQTHPRADAQMGDHPGAPASSAPESQGLPGAGMRVSTGMSEYDENAPVPPLTLAAAWAHMGAAAVTGSVAAAHMGNAAVTGSVAVQMGAAAASGSLAAHMGAAGPAGSVPAHMAGQTGAGTASGSASAHMAGRTAGLTAAHAGAQGFAGQPGVAAAAGGMFQTGLTAAHVGSSAAETALLAGASVPMSLDSPWARTHAHTHAFTLSSAEGTGTGAFPIGGAFGSGDILPAGTATTALPCVFGTSGNAQQSLAHAGVWVAAPSAAQAATFGSTFGFVVPPGAWQFYSGVQNALAGPLSTLSVAGGAEPTSLGSFGPHRPATEDVFADADLPTGDLPTVTPLAAVAYPRLVDASATGSAGTCTHAPSSLPANTPSTAVRRATATASSVSTDMRLGARRRPGAQPQGLKQFGGLGALQWTEEEDEKLRSAIAAIGCQDWSKIAAMVPRRTAQQCMSRWVRALKQGAEKGPWAADEDAIIREAVRDAGPDSVSWAEVAGRVGGRLAKQCRERWFNVLDPAIRKGPFEPDEDRIIYEAHVAFGNRWSEIARLLPGRTENAVKNRWHSAARRRWFSEMELPLDDRDKAALASVLRPINAGEEAHTVTTNNNLNPFMGGYKYIVGLGWDPSVPSPPCSESVALALLAAEEAIATAKTTGVPPSHPSRGSRQSGAAARTRHVVEPHAQDSSAAQTDIGRSIAAAVAAAATSFMAADAETVAGETPAADPELSSSGGAVADAAPLLPGAIVVSAPQTDNVVPPTSSKPLAQCTTAIASSVPPLEVAPANDSSQTMASAGANAAEEPSLGAMSAGKDTTLSVQNTPAALEAPQETATAAAPVALLATTTSSRTSTARSRSRAKKPAPLDVSSRIPAAVAAVASTSPMLSAATLGITVSSSVGSADAAGARPTASPSIVNLSSNVGRMTLGNASLSSQQEADASDPASTWVGVDGISADGGADAITATDTALPSGTADAPRSRKTGRPRGRPRRHPVAEEEKPVKKPRGRTSRSSQGGAAQSVEDFTGAMAAVPTALAAMTHNPPGSFVTGLVHPHEREPAIITALEPTPFARTWSPSAGTFPMGSTWTWLPRPAGMPMAEFARVPAPADGGFGNFFMPSLNMGLVTESADSPSRPSPSSPSDGVDLALPPIPHFAGPPLTTFFAMQPAVSWMPQPPHPGTPPGQWRPPVGAAPGSPPAAYAVAAANPGLLDIGQPGILAIENALLPPSNTGSPGRFDHPPNSFESTSRTSTADGFFDTPGGLDPAHAFTGLTDAFAPLAGGAWPPLGTPPALATP